MTSGPGGNVSSRARRIYLDHNASAPLWPEAGAAMAVTAREASGNPSSVHGSGRRARQVVEEARAFAAAMVGAATPEIFFTSGATESNATLICGIGLHRSAARRRAGQGPGAIVTTDVEHPSVLGAAARLVDAGLAWRRLPVDPQGWPRMDELDEVLGDDAVLLSVAAANHELGNLAPLHALAVAAHHRGAVFHTDAAQAAGRIPLDLHAMGVDAATWSGHKMHGPPGTGLAFLRRGLDLLPLMSGGGQERGVRPGTENVVGIAGLGAACALHTRLLQAQPRVRDLRDELQRRLLALPGARLHGHPTHRLAGTLNVGFQGVPGALAVAALDLEGVEASTGAACWSGTVEPSRVLLALGMAPERAAEAIRFSLGPEVSETDVPHVAELTASIVARIRASGTA